MSQSKAPSLLDLAGASAEAGGMEERIDILEREVSAIKAEIAVIKATYWTCENARVFDARLSHVEADIAVLKADVAVLKADVAQLKVDIALLKADIEQLKIDVAQIKVVLAHLATKEELRNLEARLKAWVMTLTVSTITVICSIQFALYTALKH